jgi:hypothetical protein
MQDLAGTIYWQPYHTEQAQLVYGRVDSSKRNLTLKGPSRGQKSISVEQPEKFPLENKNLQKKQYALKNFFLAVGGNEVALAALDFRPCSEKGVRDHGSC